MIKEQNKYFIYLLIVVNLILWSFFIIPSLLNLFTNSSAIKKENVHTGEKPKLFEETPVIDFTIVRNPFSFAEEETKTTKKKKTSSPITMVKTNREIPQNTEEKYVSRFRLKSIVLLKNKYTAALEESTPVTETTENDVYRFINPGEQQTTAKTTLVMEGEIIQGEKVEKIGSDYVILSKNGKYYKLTFSGGIPVNKPQLLQ